MVADEFILKDLLEMRDENKIREAQKITHFGKYKRIRYGEEKDEWDTNYPCHDCLSIKGEVHSVGCDVEECPVCHHQLIGCGHLIDEKFSESKPVTKFNPRSIINPLFMDSAKKDYFVKISAIMGIDNGVNKFLIFRDKDQRVVIYCDKVLTGEKLEQAIERILLTNLGIKELISIRPKPMLENFLSRNPRAVVSLTVKFQELKVSPSFPFTVEWLTLEEMEKQFHHKDELAQKP